MASHFLFTDTEWPLTVVVYGLQVEEVLLVGAPLPATSLA